MYIYIHIYEFTYIFICIHVYICIYIHMFMYITYDYVCIHVLESVSWCTRRWIGCEHTCRRSWMLRFPFFRAPCCLYYMLSVHAVAVCCRYMLSAPSAIRLECRVQCRQVRMPVHALPDASRCMIISSCDASSSLLAAPPTYIVCAYRGCAWTQSAESVCGHPVLSSIWVAGKWWHNGLYIASHNSGEMEHESSRCCEKTWPIRSSPFRLPKNALMIPSLRFLYLSLPPSRPYLLSPLQEFCVLCEKLEFTWETYRGVKKEGKIHSIIKLILMAKMVVVQWLRLLRHDIPERPPSPTKGYNKQVTCNRSLPRRKNSLTYAVIQKRCLSPAHLHTPCCFVLFDEVWKMKVPIHRHRQWCRYGSMEV